MHWIYWNEPMDWNYCARNSKRFHAAQMHISWCFTSRITKKSLPFSRKQRKKNSPCIGWLRLQNPFLLFCSYPVISNHNFFFRFFFLELQAPSIGEWGIHMPNTIRRHRNCTLQNAIRWIEHSILCKNRPTKGKNQKNSNWAAWASSSF